jgi:hypothetical protein
MLWFCKTSIHLFHTFLPACRFQHRPPETWLSDALRALNANLPFLDGRGASEILASLVTLGARLSDNSWLERFCRIVGGMDMRRGD